MDLDMETIGYFLYMEEQENNSRGDSEDTDQEIEDNEV